MMTRGPLQETIAVDVLVDKMLKARTPYVDIIKTINTVLSTKRPLDDSYIEDRLAKIAKYQERLGKLQRLPVVEQRSAEWHSMRKGLVTASEFAQALGKAKFGTQKDFYKKKCGYEQTVFNPGEAPLKWGTMYEDVAVEIYKHRYGYEFYNFGLISHPTVKHFGASPDGINDFGIMVEIKCPYRRKITGEVPQQYYFQIQGQLSVCELKECDFVECELDEYDCMETWLEVGHEEKGIVVERLTDDPLNPWTYSYSPVWMSSNKLEDQEKVRKQADEYIERTVASNENVIIRYWTLRVFNCVRVYRDDSFVNDKFMELEPIWNNILTYRDDFEKYKGDIKTTKRALAKIELQNSLSTPTPTSTTTPTPTTTMTWNTAQTTLSGYAFLD
jgi:putative phage-type endonuclease